MQKEFHDLIIIAMEQRSVARKKITGNLSLFAYPLQSDGCILGIGYDKDFSHLVKIQDILLKRSSQIARYSTWLPSVFNDGSVYLLKRVILKTDFDTLEHDFNIAQELLS